MLYNPCKEYPKVYGVKTSSDDGLAHISLFTSIDDAIIESNSLWHEYQIHNEIIVFPLCGSLTINKNDDI